MIAWKTRGTGEILPLTRNQIFPYSTSYDEKTFYAFRFRTTTNINYGAAIKISFPPEFDYSQSYELAKTIECYLKALTVYI